MVRRTLLTVRCPGSPMVAPA
ncbi:hypothetical protein EAX62_03515 [Tessaracoccus antarcticus]|uniref:Uncharacterized protein n=1 Tax=Tessaracoccus antarcticus TaxID=2479848 RepID=A0A3M0GDP3_9ACTN|nr:hypothetical protein EAX62_03515 [Tessaracoccus antarcticus]